MNVAKTFTELNLHPLILSAVTEQGYTQPTPIQAGAIPIVLTGKDLMAGAQTGTGKTAAFTLPLLDWLHGSPIEDRRKKSVRILVLTPTRELAAQVGNAVRTYGQNLKVRSTIVFGGVGQAAQVNAIKDGVDVLVATPGRLLDLQDQGLVDLSRVEKLVLDEADRMLDMGFIVDVKKILALLPKEKQSLLFSATFDDAVVELAKGLLSNPEHIQVTPKNTTVERIAQISYRVGRSKKMELLAHLISSRDWSQVLVFTRTKFMANQVADFLEKQGVHAMSFHGNKSQTLRTRAMGEFREGKIRALVATDIMARGIDIESLPHVVNYDIPNQVEDYVHRIGRTGRAGLEGEAINFVSLDEEGFMVNVEKFTRQSVPQKPMIDEFLAFAPEEDEVAEPIAMGRQTLWGGLGKAPGREVMAKVARRARQEMMDRNREQRQKHPRPRSSGAPGNEARPQKSRTAPQRPRRDPREGGAESGEDRQPMHFGNPAFSTSGQVGGRNPKGDRYHKPDQKHKPRNSQGQTVRRDGAMPSHKKKSGYQAGEHYTGVSTYRREDADSILGVVLSLDKKKPNRPNQKSFSERSGPKPSNRPDDQQPQAERKRTQPRRIPPGGFLTNK